MLPSLSKDDVRDGCLMNTVLISDGLLCPLVGADGRNVRLLQFRQMLRRPAALSALLLHVKGVISVAAPTKVRWVEARRIVARVEGIVIGRAWTRFPRQNKNCMGNKHFCSVDLDTAIPAMVATKRPFPATLRAVAGGKIGCENMYGPPPLKRKWVSILAPKLVVVITKPPCQRYSGAIGDRAWGSRTFDTLCHIGSSLLGIGQDGSVCALPVPSILPERSFA